MVKKFISQAQYLIAIEAERWEHGSSGPMKRPEEFVMRDFMG